MSKQSGGVRQKSAAAVKHVDNRALEKMGIVYQVRGGRQSCGFMSESQVSLASMTHTESVDKEFTSSTGPETVVVEPHLWNCAE